MSGRDALRLADEVRELARAHDAAADLLGRIIATLRQLDNYRLISERLPEALPLVDRYIQEYTQLQT